MCTSSRILTHSTSSGVSKTYGNRISIQIVENVRVIRQFGIAYSVPAPSSEPDLPQDWALCHVEDCAGLYLVLIRHFLNGSPAEAGVYFAENGVFSWDLLSKCLLRGLGYDETVKVAGPAEIEKMATAINKPASLVRLTLAGR